MASPSRSKRHSVSSLVAMTDLEVGKYELPIEPRPDLGSKMHQTNSVRSDASTMATMASDRQDSKKEELMMHEAWNANALTCNRSASKSAPCSPIKPIPGPIARSVPFHVAHKVPVGDTPYVSAKRVQAAINAGDRVDSALKDMAIVMKQQNRSVAPAAVIRPGAGVVVPHTVGLVQEVREIGRLNRAPDSPEAQASTDPEGARLQQKRTKMARSKGRKF
ncbi:hypothetical protein ZIOFF_059731 [Zingiber officinale]|uniref:Uncharacterized protein n=1 Tax=Zingiber officinale TaxID=94328 RepID=A0A8J5KH48_ZINOF|nr:hypothetical protein ZIOFF_059731 [Zingiber officinale]